MLPFYLYPSLFDVICGDQVADLLRLVCFQNGHDGTLIDVEKDVRLRLFMRKHVAVIDLVFAGLFAVL